MRLLVAFIFLTLVVTSGCKKDPPSPPDKALLTAPANNEECSPIASSSGANNTVRFTWQAADNTDSYQLHIRNLITNNAITRNLEVTSENVSLPKGTPFSWFVITENQQTADKVMSDTWRFYNPGSETAHVPFPAEIISPRPGASVVRDVNNEILLEWEGSDIDNDIESYEIYFSTENPPETLIETLNANAGSQRVSVDADTIYYWRIVTTDAEGNTSDTGTLDFRVL